MKSKSQYITQVSCLSPSWDLLKTYLSLKEQGNWNENTFKTIYRPRFIEQIKKDKLAHAKLKELIEKHNEGKSIALVCFCADVNLCHRSIISEILTVNGIKHTLN